jgi:dienelactone hydrolase
MIQAYLLEPDGDGPFPGLVLLHDHGARFDIGKEKLVKPLPSQPDNILRSSRQWIDTHFDGVWLGDALAAAGYAVIVPDMLYWGSRSSDACRRWSRAVYGSDSLSKSEIKALKTEVYEGQRAVYDSLYACGSEWAWQTMREDSLAAALLASRSRVSPDRIGACGWSMGGHRAWLLAAFCPDIKAGCTVSWMTLKQLQQESPSEYSMRVEELRSQYDFPDIASFLKPRPYYFLSGDEDHLFPAWAVDSCYTLMHGIYGKDAPLRTEFFHGGHHCGREVQDRILHWFDEML